MHPENNLGNEAINKNYDKLMEYAKKNMRNTKR